MSNQVGFTSTVPVEVILGAGLEPVDLNNIFINSENPGKYIELSEMHGFPRNICAWIKGLYTIAEDKGIKRIICIGEGDCASAVSMCEILSSRGTNIIPFSYPTTRNKDKLNRELNLFAQELGTTLEMAEEIRKRLKPVRDKLKQLDKLTWKERKVRGAENHLWLVSSSDFNGNPNTFNKELSEFLSEAESRKSMKFKRLAYIGVPPILNDLYTFLNSLGGDVVYNETQRQFAMPFSTDNLIDQYLEYSYPYGITYRLERDIIPELKRRDIEGVIHYVQSFCHRQVEDILIREAIDLPILTLEADKPGKLDNRTRIRLEAFMEML
ncbi:MAG: 2-hydroxyacyl-CoA dehydratase [Acidobacteria bacterium]|nr:2-hydroxyacyl-CoA dehydratase [Acidobacteriota bacterium]